MRRRNPDDVPPLRLDAQQRRQRESQLADTFALEQHFGKRTLRPAAAGQDGIERSKTGRQRRGLRRAIVAAPDGRIGQKRRERGIHRIDRTGYSFAAGPPLGANYSPSGVSAAGGSFFGNQYGVPSLCAGKEPSSVSTH